MFSTFIDTYPRSPPLETCAQFPLDAHSVDAQGELMDRFLLSQSEDQLRECYLHLLKLLPQWTSLDLLVNNLPNLLDRSASFKEEQEQLALALGQRYLKAGELKKAMLCFAKALQINRSQENYLAAFKVFVHYFQLHQERRLNNFLINSTPTPDKIAFHIETIGALKQLGLPKECLTPFFNKLRDTIHQIPNEKQHAYRAHVQTIFDLRNSSWDTQQTPIERYWQALQKFRACFVKKDAHEVQEEAFNAMKQLIALCIGDICTLIGSPPCDYDLRAMGSLGRKEMCPYSDLEFIVLIEDEEHRPYFTRMVQLLELQIASFGETQGLDFVFTCLPNRSGLHLDSSPLQDERLMQNPEHMAQIQRQTDCYTKCMVLKTTSLYQTTSLLYIDYQAQLQAIRKDFPFAFFDICKQRVNEFSFTWKNHFDRAIFAYNIKTNFVETLYHPLSDLALYFGIESTNTLEIADALIDHKVLPEKMRDLLKESISLIYQIRVFNHQEHHTQEEKAYLSSTQIATLEKCYWKILIPLHTCLKKLVAPTEPHRQFFEELCSKIKDPQELAKGLKGSTSILDAILHLPSSCTVRPIYTMKIDALQASIIAITSLPPPSVPGETSVKIKTPHFTRSLWPSLARKIMEGLVLKKEYESAHRVCRLQYGVHDLHFKQTPSNPLMEYAIHSLVSRIAGEYTPPTTLVRFDVEQQGQTKSYPVLISQTIPGENLKTAWPKAIPNRSYTWNLLLAILTKPRDGHLSNYIFYEQDIFCIDNELSFAEPVTSTILLRGMFTTVHFSSALFCIHPLETTLDKEVLKEFVALDAVAICEAWVKEVIDKEKEYVQLFTEAERKTLYEKDNCTLNILLKEGTFSTLNLQFWQLQNAVQVAINQNKKVTARDLLRQLISLTEVRVGDAVYKAYNNNRGTPGEKWQAALERRENGSVTLDEYHKNCFGEIPDFEEHEKTKKYALAEAANELCYAFAIEPEHAYFKNSRGKCAVGAKFQDLKNPIRERQTLRYIKERMKLLPQKIQAISFHYSTLLDNENIQFFLHPELEKIDLRYCSKVNNKTVRLIQEKCPNLKELILIECPNITNLGESFFSPRLNFTHVERFELTHTACTNLVFTAPKLRFLDISHNLELVYLDFETPSLLEIDAEKSTKIQLSPQAKKHIIVALARKPKNLTTAPLELKNNREVVIKIIFQDALALAYAATQFTKEEEIVLKAVNQNGLALQYASQDLKNDRKIVLAALQRNIRSLQHASEELKSDKKFLLNAMQIDLRALCYASEKLKKDRKFILGAIEQNGYVLKYAPQPLKSDREFVLDAIKRNGTALECAAEEFKSDREFLLAAVQQNGTALECVAEEFKSDEEIVLAAVQENEEALKCVINKEIVLAVLQENGRALEYANKQFKIDEKIVLAAVQQNGLALEYAAQDLKKDKKIVLTAVQQNREALKYVSDREIVLAAVQQNGLALKYAAEEFKRDKGIVLCALEKIGEPFEYAAEEFKTDRKFVLAAVKKSGYALKYAVKEFKSDEKIVLAAVQQNGWALQFAANGLKSNKKIVLTAVQQNGLAVLHAAEELKSDKDFLLAAVQKNELAFEYAAKEFKSNRAFLLNALQQNERVLKYVSNKKIVLAAVQQNGLALQYVPEELKRDREIVLAAVRENGQALQYAAKELKRDKKIVLAALQENGEALKYAAKELKSDRCFLLAAVKESKCAFEYAAVWLKSDREFVLETVQQNGGTLEYALEEFKSNKAFVLAAVEKNGLALKYAVKEFKIDEKIVLTAVQQNGLALKYAAKELKSNKEFVLAAVEQNERALYYAPEELRSNKEVMLAAVKKSGFALGDAFKELKGDKDIVLAAVRENGLAFKYAAKELKSDKDVLLAALRENGQALYYAPEEFRNNREFVLAAVQQNGWAFKYATEELKSDKDIVLAAVRENGWALKYASPDLRNDKEVVLTAVQNGYVFRYASPDLRKDKEFVLNAVQQNGTALKYASPKLQNDIEIVEAAIHQNGKALKYASKELKSIFASV